MVVVVEQPMDGVVIESLISDVHPGMERWVCGKFFDREADGLSGGRNVDIRSAVHRARGFMKSSVGGCNQMA